MEDNDILNDFFSAPSPGGAASAAESPPAHSAKLKKKKAKRKSSSMFSEISEADELLHAYRGETGATDARSHETKTTLLEQIHTMVNELDKKLDQKFEGQAALMREKVDSIDALIRARPGGSGFLGSPRGSPRGVAVQAMQDRVALHKRGPTVPNRDPPGSPAVSAAVEHVNEGTLFIKVKVLHADSGGKWLFPAQQSKYPQTGTRTSIGAAAAHRKTLRLTNKADPESAGKVQLEIFRANGLKNADETGKSDPYCTYGVGDDLHFNVEPNKKGKPKKVRYQTKVLYNTLDPVWNQRKEMNVNKGDMLHFIVKDYDPTPGGKAQVLGKVSLSFDQYFENGFFGELKLTEANEGFEDQGDTIDDEGPQKAVSALMRPLMDAEAEELRKQSRPHTFWDKFQLKLHQKETLCDCVMAAVIMLNAVIIGVSLDYEYGVWAIIDVLFTVAFLIEIVLKINIHTYQSVLGDVRDDLPEYILSEFVEAESQAGRGDGEDGDWEDTVTLGAKLSFRNAKVMMVTLSPCPRQREDFEEDMDAFKKQNAKEGVNFLRIWSTSASESRRDYTECLFEEMVNKKDKFVVEFEVLDTTVKGSLCEGLRFYMGGEFKYWHYFDLLILLVDVLQLIMSRFVESSLTDHTPPAAMFRMLRLIRLTRLLKLLNLEPLQDLVAMITGIVGGMSTLMWALSIFVVVVYVTALLLREFFGRTPQILTCEECGDIDMTLMFDSVPRAMLTAFRFLTGDFTTIQGVNLYEGLQLAYGTSANILVCFVHFLVAIGIFNVITAIFVERTIDEAHKLERNKMTERLQDPILWKRSIEAIIRGLYKDKVDDDGNPLVTIPEYVNGKLKPHAFFKEAEEKLAQEPIFQDEFNKMLRDPEAREALEDLEINAADFRTLFDILDADNSAEISLSELLDGLSRLRGFPRRSDTISIDLMVRAMQQDLHELTELVNSMFEMEHQVLDYVTASLYLTQGLKG